jgi:hypothetical protein
VLRPPASLPWAWCLNKFLVPAGSPTRHLDPPRPCPLLLQAPAQPGHSIRLFRRPGGARGCPLSQKSVIWLTLENGLDTTPWTRSRRAAGRLHGQVGPKSCHQMAVLEKTSSNDRILSKLSAFFCKRSVLVPFRPTCTHIVDIGKLKVPGIFSDHKNGRKTSRLKSPT